MAIQTVPLAQRIARWTSNPKVLGSIPRWDDCDFCRLSVLIRTPLMFCTANIPDSHNSSFLSVAVITCASHAQGRRFEPGRKQNFILSMAACSNHLGFRNIMDISLYFFHEESQTCSQPFTAMN